MLSLFRTTASYLPGLVACLFLLSGCGKECPIAPADKPDQEVLKSQGSGIHGNGTGNEGSTNGSSTGDGKDPHISDDGDDMGDSQRDDKKRPRH